MQQIWEKNNLGMSPNKMKSTQRVEKVYYHHKENWFESDLLFSSIGLTGDKIQTQELNCPRRRP